MRRLKIPLVVALVGCGTLASVQSANAFCRTTTCKVERDNCNLDERGCPRVGVPLSWATLPIVYRFHSAGTGFLLREETRATIRSAFHRWSDTVCPDGRTSLRFVEGEDIELDKPLEPDVQAAEPYGIFFRDRGWPYEGKADSTLAQTNTRFGTRGGVIIYADMEINSSAKRFTLTDADSPGDAPSNSADLQAVITHEAGHYIGLAHSDDPASIMAARYCDRPEKRCDKGKAAGRRLAPDDVSAVCALYPPGSLRTTPAEPPGASCASGSAPASSGVALVGSTLFVAFSLMVARRRRR